MIQKEYVLSVPLEIEVDKKRIVDLITLELENNELSVWMIRFLLSRLRICKTKTANVRELVYNGGKVNRNGEFMNEDTWDKHDEDCRCNVYDLPKIDGHVCCKGNEVKDVQLHGILAINCKTPVFCEVGEAFDGFVSGMSKLMNSMVKECKFYQLIDKCKEAVTVNSDNSRCMISKGYVKAVMKEYKGLIFSELDKNVNSWSIMCEHRYKQLLCKNFGILSDNYEVCDKSREDIEASIMTEYDDKFGNRCKGMKNWNLNRGRVICKDKDINRVRPIVSYRRWYGRMYAKRIARALNIMIKIIVQGYENTKGKGRNKSKKAKKGVFNTMEMLNVNEASGVIYGLNKMENWKKQIADDKFTSVELDIKEQFTSLDRNECLEGLKWITDGMRGLVSNPVFLVMKRMSDKAGDRMLDGGRVTVTNKRYAHILTIDEVVEYVKF